MCIYIYVYQTLYYLKLKNYSNGRSKINGIKDETRKCLSTGVMSITETFQPLIDVGPKWVN